MFFDDGDVLNLHFIEGVTNLMAVSVAGVTEDLNLALSFILIMCTFK